MTLQLSGYLGKKETTNVPDLAEQLAKDFDERHREHNDRPILIPVIGILRVESVRFLRDPDAEPVVAVKLASLEAAAGGTAERHATAVRELWKRLQDDRLGTESLPLDWTGEEPQGPEEGPQEPEEGDDVVEEPGAAPGVSTASTGPAAVSFSDAAAKRTRAKRA